MNAARCMDSTQFTKGFTLIELMVVLVIVAVMLSAVTISFSPNEHQRLKLMVQKAQDFMQLACDQGAMQQKMVWIEPSSQQLKAWIDRQPLASALRWVEGVKVEWKLTKHLNPSLGVQQNEALMESTPLETVESQRYQGWRCWPSGQWDPGELIFEAEAHQAGLKLSWDSWGRFQLKPLE